MLSKGTCLIKCYLGYYRFSEDLDFTWINQRIFADKTEKGIRKIISGEISTLGSLLESIADKTGFRFKADKKDSRFIEFGGGGRFTTFKLWYDSAEMGEEQFIKIQVNYVEKFEYKLKKAVPSILGDIDKKEALFLFPELGWVFEKAEVWVYDVREILIEKARAILTRQGSKLRDFIDIYMIEKHDGLRIDDFGSKVIEKTGYMLKYEKYLGNLMEKRKEPPKFIVGQEEKLLLKPLGGDFNAFVERINRFIEELIKKIGR